MFTGIVHSMGSVRALARTASGARLTVTAPDLPRPIAPGASIAVNGACLTVVSDDAADLQFDVVPETLSRTTLGSLAAGASVNLEPSLRAGDPMDGHIVQGHMDGTGRVQQITRDQQGQIWTFSTDEDLMPYLIPKGSITIEGVSLTIARVGERSFSVALIPTTLARTTFQHLQIGDRVNIETDIVARTIVTTLQRAGVATAERPLTVDMLRENGW